MTDPIPTTVKRWKCPFCNRHESRKSNAIAHIARCWSNPDNKTCRTCAFFVPAVFDSCGIDTGVGICTCGSSPEQCDLGIDLPDRAPVVNCTEWGDAERARWEGVAFGGCGRVSEVSAS
jgi:hypothetical protein